MKLLAEYSTVKKILSTQHAVVIYAEHRSYYQYYSHLINNLLLNASLTILYITSDKQDKLLTKSADRLKVVYVNNLVQFLLPRLNAKVVIMTMTDLNNYGYKRSLQVTKYIYQFHAPVSMHQQYTEKAFFHYDAILCTGGFHCQEAALLKQRYKLPCLDPIPYGYPLFDLIGEKFLFEEIQRNGKIKPSILIAPSWFSSSVTENYLPVLLTQLSGLPYDILVRLHPEYIKRKSAACKKIMKWVSDNENFTLDRSEAVVESIVQADILITDRSGIAFDYAFGTFRPVLFIETPLKINNPHWASIGLEPIENKLRQEIGISIHLNELHGIAEAINRLLKSTKEYREKLKSLKVTYFYNTQEHTQQAIQYILNTINQTY